ncbi:MAG: sigma 54-interacting transcriptional regulator [Candidatus Acidiferrales bacterium]
MNSGKDSLRVKLCSPDSGFAQAVARALGDSIQIDWSQSFSLAKEPDEKDAWEVVLLDLRAAVSETDGEAGLSFIRESAQIKTAPPVIGIVPADDHALARRVRECGAYDMVTSPPDISHLRLVLRRARAFYELEKETQQLRSERHTNGQFGELLGTSPGMQEVFALALKIAPCDVSVLITGETGTGKELLARAIHRMSPRASGTFLAFSCANLPESLVEDELFGHEKGAFTGAIAQRRGRLEMADRGTLLLDELGDLGLGLQPKLLRVLQERTFERIGGSSPVAVNIRLICATHHDIEGMVRDGKFREDLYYRLNVITLTLPPLRERREDIVFLSNHFLQKFTNQFGKKSRRFSPTALRALEEYDWPGNVRQLENVVQRAVVLADSSTIEAWHLPGPFQKGGDPVVSTRSSFEEEVREFKRRLILRTLRDCQWHKTDTARTLGLARNYLHRLINQLQIRPEATAVPAPAQILPPPGRVM